MTPVKTKEPKLIKNPRLTLAALTLALTLGAGASFAAEENWESLMMKPNRAASLDVGSKRVVGYFLKTDDLCKLTAMLADRKDVEAAAAQLQLEIRPGETARIATADGNSLRFVCLGGAEAMTVTLVGRLALRAGAE